MQVRVFHVRGGAERVLVAEVEVPDGVSVEEAREIAFEKTNTIDRCWWTNRGVTALVSPARSTSVGDIVEIDGRVYRVDGVGWTEIKEGA